jgi:hypothetical protein
MAVLSLRSRHALGAVAVAILLGAGCSSQAEGHPEFAGTLSTPTDLPTGGGIDGPSDSPSASDTPNGSASAGGLSPKEIADKICASVSPGELKQIFDGPAEVQPGLAYQCKFTGKSAGVLVYEFPSSSLSDVMGEATHPKPRTISGHPAIVDGQTISIAESDSPDTPGILRGLTTFGKPATTIALLQKIIKAFER